jgi:hypothetical protein
MNLCTKATMPLPNVHSYSHYEEPVKVPGDIVPDPDMPGTWRYNMDVQEISVVITLVVCSTRLIAAIVAVGDFGTIALCRLGPAAWSVSAHYECRWQSHMVWFQGKLHAVDINREDLLAFDIVDDEVSVTVMHQGYLELSV